LKKTFDEDERIRRKRSCSTALACYTHGKLEGMWKGR